ncbi:MAG: hypothetical protein AAFQ07_09165, partial [Chloroflexota bacterium]
NIGEDTAKRVPLDKRVYFIPDIMTNEIVWISVTTFIMVVLCVFFYHAPLESHADPQSTPLGTTAPWYFLWIQGALKLGDKFFWGILFPTVVVGIFAVMPYLDVTKSRRYAHRRVSLSLAMLTISFMTVLSYMGLPEFAVQTARETEIVHELTFEPAHSHVGIARTIPFDELAPGAYAIAQFDGENPRFALEDFEASFGNADGIGDLVVYEHGSGFTTQYEMTRDYLIDVDHLAPNDMPTGFRLVADDAPMLEEVLEEFGHLLHGADELLVNASGLMVVSDWQEGLRRVDLVIVWDGVELEAGEPVIGEDGEAVELVYQLNGEDLYFQTNAEGNIIMDDSSEPNLALMDAETGEFYAIDDEGEALLDEAGNRITYETATTVQQQRIYTGHIYLHEDAAYFE